LEESLSVSASGDFALTEMQLCLQAAKPGNKTKMDLIESALEYKLNAVVFIDPVAMLFSILKQGDLLSLYTDFRIILHRFVMRPSCVRSSCGSWIEKAAEPIFSLIREGDLLEVCGDFLYPCHLSQSNHV
jgi:hypothetical protein